MSVCLSVCPQDYLDCNDEICMKLLPEVCLGPGYNILGVDRITILIQDPDYGGGIVQSLTDCLFSIYFFCRKWYSSSTFSICKFFCAKLLPKHVREQHISTFKNSTLDMS